ncbi:MAG: DUF3592 domain-containing protein [Anaerolineaceae bacterium]
MNINQPTIFRIIKIDFTSFIATIFPPCTWVVLLYFYFSNPGHGNTANFSIFASAATVIGLVVLVWRTAGIRAIFSDGLQASGTITNLSFFRDRGRVNYVYTHQGQKIVGGNAIMKTKETTALEIGQEITLLVDRGNPKRAFIRELYLEKL